MVSPPALKLGLSGDPALDYAQIKALSKGYAAWCIEQGELGVLTLTEDAKSAKATLAQWPDIDAISRCYASPGDGCLCSKMHAIHDGPPSPVPGWVVDAQLAREHAHATLAALQVALTALAGMGADEVKLAALSPQDMTAELVQLWWRNRPGYWMSVDALADDPDSQAPIAAAKAQIAAQMGWGQQAGPRATVHPMLSNPQVRNSLPHLEGTRHRGSSSVSPGSSPSPARSPAPSRRPRGGRQVAAARTAARRLAQRPGDYVASYGSLGPADPGAAGTA